MVKNTFVSMTMEKRFWCEVLLLTLIFTFATSSYSDFNPSSNLEYSVPENDFQNKWFQELKANGWACRYDKSTWKVFNNCIKGDVKTVPVPVYKIKNEESLKKRCHKLWRGMNEHNNIKNWINDNFTVAAL